MRSFNNVFNIKSKGILFIPIVIICFIIMTGFSGIYGFSNIGDYQNRQFKESVVFYPQHQDDEVLWAGSAIVEAIKECGKDNVFVVQVSNGSGISIFNKDEKYRNMTREEKTKLRENEFLASVDALGVKRENVILLPQINNSGTTDFNLMERVALEFEKNLKSVTHIAHTYKLDDHLQHIKNGSIIQGLYNAGKIKDAKYFVKPKFANKIKSSEKIVYKADSQEEYEKVKKA
ncbi:MAG: PIG-L family deacetylase, partial [Romboutsia sp.]|uniref:PIG-L family deacetylase n=1 Tax=Romboutsia sp. TaxID=1965302 RepID=UPI003F3C5CFA